MALQGTGDDGWAGEDFGGGQRWQRQTTTAADNNNMQEWAEDYKGGRQERAARDYRDIEWQSWLRRWKMVAVDNNNGGG